MTSTFCKHCNQERKNHSAKKLLDCTLSLIEGIKI